MTSLTNTVTNGPPGHSSWTPTRRQLVSQDTDLSAVIDLLEDDTVRAILEATSVEPRSKNELAEDCGVSLPTVSRRVDRLEGQGLVRETTRIRSDGHHDSVYVAQLDRFELRLREGRFEYDLDRTNRDMSDELERLWSKF